MNERARNNEDKTNYHAMKHIDDYMWSYKCIILQSGVLLRKSKRVKKDRDAYYEHLIVGNSPPHNSNKYIQADQRIRRIVSSYDVRQPLEYLRGIAHN